MISTEHIPYPVEWRSGVVEWATVTVAGPTGSMDEACAAAYALAERAFPRLPTP